MIQRDYTLEFTPQLSTQVRDLSPRNSYYLSQYNYLITFLTPHGRGANDRRARVAFALSPALPVQHQHATARPPPPGRRGPSSLPRSWPPQAEARQAPPASCYPGSGHGMFSGGPARPRLLPLVKSSCVFICKFPTGKLSRGGWEVVRSPVCVFTLWIAMVRVAWHGVANPPTGKLASRGRDPPRTPREVVSPREVVMGCFQGV